MKYISKAKNGSSVEIELTKIKHIVAKGNDITVHLTTGSWLHYYGREEHGKNILDAWLEFRATDSTAAEAEPCLA
jgi:hypothetical protein